MLKEFQGDIFVGGVLDGKFERNREHIKTEHAHPACAVTLFDPAAGWQRFAPVKDADIIQPEKATLKDVQSLGILAVDPPCEVEHQFMEHPLQEGKIAPAMLLLVDLV